MNHKYPKILIITETFKNNTGGGITLTNLFYGYPKEKLANAVDAVFIPEIFTDSICDNFYALGSKERKVIRFFSFFKSKYESGRYKFNKSGSAEVSKLNKNYSKKEFFRKQIWKLIQFLGLNHRMFRTELSDEFKNWLTEFSPDIVYSQLGSLENINFTEEVVKFTNSKLAIHIMDDWPKVIGNYGIFKAYWNRQVESRFAKVVGNSDICLSISEGMSFEYLKRYKKHFKHFHNPIDTKLWLEHTKRNFEIKPDNVKILYAGRIGRGISESIIDCLQAIQKVIDKGYIVEVQIQTTSIDDDMINKFKEFSFVKINPKRKYEELPKIFSSVDILLMPFDFNKEGIDFLRYSMPTKASEYMISGTPILLYSSKELSITTDAQRHGWALSVTENNIQSLSEKILELIADEKLRKGFSEKAVEYAYRNFDKTNVQADFHKVFVDHFIIK